MPTTELTVNGRRLRADDDPATPLLWVLRDTFGLTGTKYGCGIAQCGACTVHVEGEPRRACVTPLSSVAGKHVTTIEGLARDVRPRGAERHPVQQAWLDEQVMQCGYCQAGQIMAAAALLKVTPQPTDAQIDEAMAANICRCGTYVRIRRAVHRAAKLMATGAALLLMAAVGARASSASQSPGGESDGVRAFRDVASVLTSPRCVNCHVPDDWPRQGDDHHRHTMLVMRGADGRGTPALRCGTCHQATNATVPHAPPGVEGWRLPPPATPMAWHGLSLTALCRDLRDPAKTGGRSVAQLVDHVSKDHLVHWAWEPGPGRSVPPLTHEQFVARFATWRDQGAPCPASDVAEVR